MAGKVQALTFCSPLYVFYRWTRK